MRLYVKTLPTQNGAVVLGVSTSNGIIKIQLNGAVGALGNKSVRCGTKD